MKITYFRLKGYIKVLNGMGLDEIVIPFGTFKNRIILVQGENGCSKSTIIAALTPNPDSSDSFRTDVFIDDNGNRQIIEYPAEKEIHYVSMDEDGSENYYRILIQSLVDDSRTRRTTKAFISKNGEELNPNGNVSSFKEVRDAIMGIDPIYLDLSAISSENRGIVDMIPSERRKYMASYIGSLDTYNNIFKNISKKVANLKSYMNTLNSKIYELGDENELRLKLLQLETSLKDLNKKRDKLLGDLAEAEATVKIYDPDNKMQDLYVSILERLETINSDMKRFQDSIALLSKKLSIDAQNTDIYKLRDSVEESIKDYEKQISDGKAKISTLITLNEATMKSIDSDRSMLEGLSSNMIQDNIESAVASLREEALTYTKYLKDSEVILESVSLDELYDLRDAISEFTNEIASIEEFAGGYIFGKAVGNSLDKAKIDLCEKTLAELRSNSIVLVESVANKSRDLETAIADLKELENFNSTRPAGCKINDCPYIAKYIKLQNSGLSKDKVDKLSNELQIIKISQSENSADIDTISTMVETVKRINTAVSRLQSKKSVFMKIPELRFFDDNDKIKDSLERMYRFSDKEYKIVLSYIEKVSTFKDLKRVKDQLNGLESDLKVYLNNKKLVESLSASIDKNTKEYSEREEEIKSINKTCTFVSGVLLDLSTKLADVTGLIEVTEDLNATMKDKESLRVEFESVKDKIRIVKEKTDSVNSIRSELSNVEEAIAPLSDTINQVKYNLSNMIGYQQEFKDSSEKYDKMVFIRNACSPGNGMGIQSEYIKRYMNDIIIDCNKMLGYMFNGAIQLDVPIINEKQFSIPFLGPNGIIVPDISCGSTAQKCMIGLVFSCVAMMKSSLKYNIPRFDEIDGGLDQQNRITFINVLNQILDFMRSEQCIICSHNTEFDIQSTTRILCSHTGIRIEQ